jgi:DNA-binding NarL/FixJ family response regulator
MRLIRAGEDYISPMLQKVIKTITPPDVNNKMSKRLLECVLMLCNGYRVHRMCDQLQLTKRTMENYLHRLYEAFNVEGREEMVALAWRLHLVNDDDIKFYDDRILSFYMPDWAEKKMEIDRRIAG